MNVTGPQNPVCPECGEAVGATSTYCMHCDADFDAPVEESAFVGGDATGTTDSPDQSTAADDSWGGTDQESLDDDGSWGGSDQESLDDDGSWGDSDQAVTEHPSGWDEGGPGDEGHTQGWSEGDGSGGTNDGTAGMSVDVSVGTTSDAGPDATTADGTTHDAATDSGDGGTGRNLLQSAARIGAVLLTVFVGVVTTGALMILTVEVIQLWLPLMLVAFVGIVTGGVVVARQDTGIDALADALYVTAAVVVGLPFVFMLLLPTGDPLTEKIVGGLAFSLFGAFIGVPAFLVGYVLQPDEE